MDIPIQNIYYLLCYSWNKLEEKDIVDVKGIESTELYDLFAKVLISGVSRLIKMGFDRGYIEYDEIISGIKGKPDFGVSLKRNLLKKARIQCVYDELNHNILHNQILKSTIQLLIQYRGLDKDLGNELFNISRWFSDIDDIQLNRACFRKVQIHRNNNFYDFLLKICELIHENSLPSEEKGRSKFRDFIRDEKQMSYIFENFVRNFYKIEQNIYKVQREDIPWDATTDKPEILPKMQTDISIDNKEKKFIIDTKYYTEALVEYYDKKKIRSANIYQIHAYLKNIEKKGGVNINCAGILLYPTVTTILEEKATISGHDIYFKTIDLNQPWQNIHRDLLKIIGI